MDSFTVTPRVTDYFNRTVAAADEQSLRKNKVLKQVLLDRKKEINRGQDDYNLAGSHDPLRSPESQTIKLRDMGNESLMECEQRQSEECASPEPGENFRTKKLKRKLSQH